MNENHRKKMRNDKEFMDDDNFLALTLSPPVSRPHPPQPQPQLQLQRFPSMQELLFSQNQNPHIMPTFVSAPSLNPPIQDRPPPACQSAQPARTRRNQTQVLRPGKSENVPVLFPWATPRRATVHSLEYLLSMKILTITGEMQCKHCQQRFKIGYNLREEFRKLWTFIADEKIKMSDRAPKEWENPEFPDCKLCDQKGCAKPIIAEKKREINWLFLLLGRFLCCLTLDQLKYFCKHSRNHRTGAKNRVLYLTYLGLCKQLDPSGPFNAIDF